MAAPISPSKQFPLSDRSTNTHLSSPAMSVDNKGLAMEKEADLKAPANNPMDYHRQVLKEQLEEGKLKAPGHYVSPSDGIMSPCTQKLSNLKGKKFKKAGKPQVLFAKTLGKRSYDKATVENSTPPAENQDLDQDEKMQ